MSDRIQLNEENLEEVVGGAFNFYTGKTSGKLLCYVDGYGTYEPTSAGAKSKIAKMCAQNSGKSQGEILQMVLSAGYLKAYNP